MIDEGYIKYHIEWEEAPPDPAVPPALLSVRNDLFQSGLIGVYEDLRIGFGNVSALSPEDRFFISGTQTGHIAELTAAHCSEVLSYDIAANTLRCLGPVKASSEALTHAAVYACAADIRFVVHVHHYDFWRAVLAHVPTTRPDVPYGTPEMAAEVRRLYAESPLPEGRILAMAGHSEGIITFGATPEAALAALMSPFARWRAGQAL